MFTLIVPPSQLTFFSFSLSYATDCIRNVFCPNQIGKKPTQQQQQQKNSKKKRRTYATLLLCVFVNKEKGISMPFHRIEECNRGNLKRLGGRMHSKVNGRFITVILHNDQIYCIDSCCFHASGPLGDGPVKDIEDIPTIRCMWHNIIVSLDTGERITQECLLPGELDGGEHLPQSMSFPLRPQGGSGKAKRHGEKVQRVHLLREVPYEGVDSDRFPIEVDLDPNYDAEVRSDIVACNPQYARMCMEIQQRKIDNGRAKYKDDAGERNEEAEIQTMFMRTLLHSMQTANVGAPAPSSSSTGGSAAAAISGAAAARSSDAAGRSPLSFSSNSSLSNSRGVSPTNSLTSLPSSLPSPFLGQVTIHKNDKMDDTLLPALTTEKSDFVARFGGHVPLRGGIDDDEPAPFDPHDASSPKGPPGNPRAATPPPRQQ